MPKIQTLKASVLVTIFVTVIVMLYFLDNIDVCKRNQESPSFKWIFSVPSRPQPGIANDIKTDKNTEMNQLDVDIATQPIGDKTEPLVSNKFKPKGKGIIGIQPHHRHSASVTLAKHDVRSSTTEQVTDNSISTRAKDTWSTTEPLPIKHEDSLIHLTTVSSVRVSTVKEENFKDQSITTNIPQQMVEAATTLEMRHPLGPDVNQSISDPTTKMSYTTLSPPQPSSVDLYGTKTSTSSLGLGVKSSSMISNDSKYMTHRLDEKLFKDIVSTTQHLTTTVRKIETTKSPAIEEDNSKVMTDEAVPIPTPTDSEWNDYGSSFNATFTDLLPRSAYFDSRPRDGHDNATVILVQVLKTEFEGKRSRKPHKRVVGCGVDEHFTKTYKFRPLHLFTPYVHKRAPWLTHDQAMMTCYDLPVHNGSRAYIFYKDKTGETLKLESERRVHVPAIRRKVPPNRWNSSLLVCTTAYGTPPWLREWLVYQKTIGVDFIHLYAQESFITEGSVNNSVVQSYIKSGYVKLDVWKAYLATSQDYYHQQPLLYVDCIYRYRTEFDYALLYDFDDFFVPQIPEEKDIHYYANRFFSLNKTIAAFPFLWIAYFPDCGLTKKPEDIVDGNVTNHLAFPKRHVRFVKSMYRLSGILEVQIHFVTVLFPEYQRYQPIPYAYSSTWTFYSVPHQIAYVAHLREHSYPSDPVAKEECRRTKDASVYHRTDHP